MNGEPREPDEPEEPDFEVASGIACVCGVLLEGLVEDDLEMEGIVLASLLSTWLNKYDAMARDDRRRFVAEMVAGLAVAGDEEEPTP